MDPRVYVDGVYDLFHYGHAEMLGRVRAKFGPESIIIAGIARDDDCLKYKRRPIFTQDERARSVRACKYVYDVIENAPWTITQEFLDVHQIDFVCHDGAPYPSTNSEDSNTIEDKKKNQYESIFIKGDAMSRAPTCSGISRFENVPLKPAVRT
jgi:choline-phosphate cytidylyltransferase